jgi:AcrR family transcriptional regulator
VTDSWEGLFERIDMQATAEAVDVLAGADLIAEIKATLGVSITDLASMAGVSRQAVYDWIGGGQVSDANYDRLLALRRVCLDWRSLTNRPLGRLLRAKTAEGRSLLDLLGEDPLDRSLIQGHLEALAKRAAEEEGQREARRTTLTPLSEKDRYENALTHAIPASHS